MTEHDEWPTNYVLLVLLVGIGVIGIVTGLIVGFHESPDTVVALCGGAVALALAYDRRGK